MAVPLQDPMPQPILANCQQGGGAGSAEKIHVIMTTWSLKALFTRALQILIWIVTWVQPTSGDGLRNPDCNLD